MKFKTLDGKQITLNARRESTVVMDAGRNESTFTFDAVGRLMGAYLNGRTYRRSFTNEILEKQSTPRSGVFGRLRRKLSANEVRDLETRAYDFTRQLAIQLRAVGNGTDRESFAAAQQALSRINRYCYTGLEHERDEFEHIYQPVTILPPDQYRALYLQATEGCSFNQCSFCGFYRDRRFRIKAPEEFREHIRRVRAFFGGGLNGRHSIFLGDANALMIPQPQLLKRFDIVNEEFDILPRELTVLPRGLDEARAAWEAAHPIHFDGIYSFVDAFTTRRKTAREYQELAARGLRRVYVGLETGDAAVLRFLGKPNTPDDVTRLVQRVKGAGVAVGIIILIGAGGAKFQQAHIQETERLINALPLDEHDLIYFSELVDFPGSQYSARVAAAGIRPLRVDELEQQMMRMRTGFEFTEPQHSPKVSYYDVREFVY